MDNCYSFFSFYPGTNINRLICLIDFVTLGSGPCHVVDDFHSFFTSKDNLLCIFCSDKIISLYWFCHKISFFLMKLFESAIFIGFVEIRLCVMISKFMLPANFTAANVSIVLIGCTISVFVELIIILYIQDWDKSCVF